MSTDQAIEQQIQAAGANVAPRITPDDIAANIASEHYFTAADGDYKAMENAAFINGSLNGEQVRPIPAALHLLTFCVLVLRNGFTVTGESACASPENFNAEIGRRIARENAIAKIWPLMGYELRSKLATTPTTFQQRVRAEAEELEARWQALNRFIAGDTFKTLPSDERLDMHAQAQAMSTYLIQLQRRIYRFDTTADRAGSASGEPLFAKARTPYTNYDVVSWESLPYQDARLYRFCDGLTEQVTGDEVRDALKAGTEAIGGDIATALAVRKHNEATGGKSA